MEPIYSMQVESRPDVVVVRLTGEIDVSVADDVRLELAQVVADGPSDARTVEVDLTGLQFIDSSGIRVLLQTALESEPTGRLVMVVAASDPVRRVLEIAGVTDILHVAPRDDAQ